MIIVLVLSLEDGCHVAFVRKWRKCGEACVHPPFLRWGGGLGSITSRCSGKWARTHPPKELSSRRIRDRTLEMAEIEPRGGYVNRLVTECDIHIRSWHCQTDLVVTRALKWGETRKLENRWHKCRQYLPSAGRLDVFLSDYAFAEFIVCLSRICWIYFL